jgi:hypothetical protein
MGNAAPVRIRLIFAIALLLAAAGCAQAPNGGTAQQAGPPSGVLSQAEVIAEAEHLRVALLQEVPQHTTRTAESDRTWITLAKAAVAASSFAIDHPQLLVVVDRNPEVQELCIVMAQPGGLPWLVIGGSKVSTGQAGRHGYFITPTGVFPHTRDIVDYRALGTFNEQHIRGLGLKGMRVWDFGWQSAEKGWLPHHELGEMRLLLHATDPDYLEPRLGRAVSEGCIRIPASMNRFLDLHGVLDADYERAAPEDARINALLLPERIPTRLAGNALAVVDSSQQD